jgi:hypothetical protein
MRRMILPAVIWVFAAVALLAGLLLLGVGRWHRPLFEAEAAATTGDLEAALTRYADTEKRFDAFPTIRQFAPDGHSASISNQLAIQYDLERYDDLLDKASSAPSTAATHFWAGCALFAKGRLEAEPEARIGWLTRAEQEFRSALELDGTDWDTKYNYELTRYILAELRKQPQAPPKQLLQLLRPQPKQGEQPVKRIG